MLNASERPLRREREREWAEEEYKDQLIALQRKRGRRQQNIKVMPVMVVVGVTLIFHSALNLSEGKIEKEEEDDDEERKR